MTREEQILEYANSFKGKGMESEELKEIIRIAIIDGAKWADNHPIKPSLPSNLDEAARRYAIPPYMIDIDESHLDEYPYSKEAEMAFKAGAEWREQQISKLPDNLDEEAEEYASDNASDYPALDCADSHDEVKSAFKAGAEWMAKQGASYETEVGWIDGPTVLNWPEDILDGFKMGDKVIVQIRKK